MLHPRNGMDADRDRGCNFCAVLCLAVLCCRKHAAVATKEWAKLFEGTMEGLERLARLDAWLAHAGRQMQVFGTFPFPLDVSMADARCLKQTSRRKLVSFREMFMG